MNEGQSKMSAQDFILQNRPKTGDWAAYEQLKHTTNLTEILDNTKNQGDFVAGIELILEEIKKELKEMNADSKEDSKNFSSLSKVSNELAGMKDNLPNTRDYIARSKSIDQILKLIQKMI